MNQELIELLTQYINLRTNKMDCVYSQKWEDADIYRDREVELINNQIGPKIDSNFSPIPLHLHPKIYKNEVVHNFIIKNFGKPLDELELYDLRDSKLKQIGI